MRVEKTFSYHCAVGLSIATWMWIAMPGSIRAESDADLAATGETMATAFRTPPASARPWVWYHTVNGTLNTAGITADLEAMARVGIGGLTLFAMDGDKGDADFGSDRWRQVFAHLLREAQRLGLQVNLMNGAGWSTSGGPWITPELSMQKVVWSETAAEGGRHFEGALARPESLRDYYRDIAVFAFPTPETETVRMSAAGARLSTSGTQSEPGHFILPLPQPQTPQFVQVEFPQPFLARRLSFRISDADHIQGELQVSDDGRNFRKVQALQMRQGRRSLYDRA